MAPTCDMQILRELFGNCIKASEILGVDEDFRAKLKAAMARLAPNQIAKNGSLQEWLFDYEESEPGHRHQAHLRPVIYIKKTKKMILMIIVWIQVNGIPILVVMLLLLNKTIN